MATINSIVSSANRYTFIAAQDLRGVSLWGDQGGVVVWETGSYIKDPLGLFTDDPDCEYHASHDAEETLQEARNRALDFLAKKQRN